MARKLSSTDVIGTLADLFITRGAPDHTRSHQGPDFMAAAVKVWIEGVEAKTTRSETASPWENGHTTLPAEPMTTPSPAPRAGLGSQDGYADLQRQTHPPISTSVHHIGGRQQCDIPGSSCLSASSL